MRSNIIEFPLNRGEANGQATGFFTPRDASRLARIPRATLTDWAHKGVVVPDVLWTDEDDKRLDGYSFKALVYMRLIRMLRGRNYTLRKVVRAVQWLVDEFGGSPGPAWANVGIFDYRNDIWVRDRSRIPDDQAVAASRGGQQAWVMLMGPEFERFRERADTLLVPDRWQPWVAMEPGLKNGMPLVAETAIQTATIHKLHDARHLNYDEIIDYYPFLTRQQVIKANGFERFLDREELMAA